ncbi:hypothetical protein BJF90_30760 [Pseudonocardia sp. CNS-004]|nr:hypothetical protein BJF90_30760 [Pseudonocardia sp. CNS-004]
MAGPRRGPRAGFRSRGGGRRGRRRAHRGSLAAGGPDGTALAEAGTGRPVTSSAARRNRIANPIRGPPSLENLGRSRAARALRKALLGQQELRVRLADAETSLQKALRLNRELRDQYEQQAGGLRAILAGGGEAVPADLSRRLWQSNRAVITALANRRLAEANLADGIATAVRAASNRGIAHSVLRDATGLGADTITMLTGPWRGDPERFPKVDALNTRFMRWFNRGAEFGLPDGGQVTAGWLREQLGDTGRFVVLTTEDGAVVLVGRNRVKQYDLSDGHFHPAGYDHSRPPRVKGLVTWLRDAGHQGVVTFHFIPQHGKGFAPLGATFYYLVNSVLNVAFGARTPMLQMWGVFSDVRLTHEVRNLPADLRWRAVVGSTGARMDIPGAQAYLRLFTILNPDVTGMIGETTIAKEAVTRLLGPQAIHTINPEWRAQVDRLVAGAGLLRTALDEGRIADTDMPAALRAMVAGGAERDATMLLPVLLANVDAIRSLLAAAGTTVLPGRCSVPPTCAASTSTTRTCGSCWRRCRSRAT